MNLEFIKKLVKSSNTKIVFLVMDGIGGLPLTPYGLTELETAKTPNLDRLASEGVCGLQEPVKPGITPGSGPGHLSLFGYNPTKYTIGRGVLSALGINFKLTEQDVAARGNFCTVDEEGKVADRRAGRIPTEKNEELCKKLREIDLPDVDVFVQPVKEYRFLLVLRGKNLSGDISNTDPQDINEFPLDPEALSSKAEKTADLVGQFIEKAGDILKDQDPANMILLRGFSQKPDWPKMKEVYNLNCGAIAAYPMYRGLAKLLGMEILETGTSIAEEFQTLKNNWDKYDFFYLHIKPTDSSGEDGNFNKKVDIIEKVDSQIPILTGLEPDVVVVTGDHSTPSLLKYHSWHPVPIILWSKHCRADQVKSFGEKSCVAGGLGPRFPAEDIMSMSLANALRLEKYGP